MIVLQECEPDEEEQKLSESVCLATLDRSSTIDYERINELKRERRSARDLALPGEGPMLDAKKQEVIRKVERSLMKERLTQGMGRLDMVIGTLGEDKVHVNSRNGVVTGSGSASGGKCVFSKESANVIVSGKSLSLVQAEFFGNARTSARTRGL